MIDKKILLPRIRQYADFGCPAHNLALKAVDDICEIIREMPEVDSESVAHRWIPVTERLPEKDGQFVLTFRDSGMESDMEVHFHKNDNPGVFQQFGGLVKTYNVTHWMPLPDPPKED